MSTVENSAVTVAPEAHPSQPSELSSNLAPEASAPGTGVDDASPRPENATTPTALDTSLQSQPMTATASTSSSLQPPLENGDNPSSYGTRSRNRTGGPRPNYAEDKELDLEIEALSKPIRSSKRSSAAATIEQHSNGSGFAAVNGVHQPDKPAENGTANTAPCACPGGRSSAVEEKKTPWQ